MKRGRHAQAIGSIGRYIHARPKDAREPFNRGAVLERKVNRAGAPRSLNAVEASPRPA